MIAWDPKDYRRCTNLKFNYVLLNFDPSINLNSQVCFSGTKAFIAMSLYIQYHNIIIQKFTLKVCTKGWDSDHISLLTMLISPTITTGK